MSKELNKALELLREIRPSIPKDVLELWCKDRDAFLAQRSEFHQHLKECADEVATWPTYKREALGPFLGHELGIEGETETANELNKAPVEQAGGDERAAQWHECTCPKIGEKWNPAKHGKDCPVHQARAALAQPSPASDLDPLNLAPHAKAFNEAPAEALKSEQAEAERREVVDRVVHSNPIVLGQCGPLNANDELMTVAQHAASVARWAEMFNRVEQERDAALARVAELEKQEPVAWVDVDWIAQVSDPRGDGCTVRRAYGSAGVGLVPLYAAPVAQAQHSVPDVCDGKEQDAFEEWARKEGLDTSCHPMHWLFLDAKTNSARQGWKAALRYVRAQVAAAPGKEVGHE